MYPRGFFNISLNNSHIMWRKSSIRHLPEWIQDDAWLPDRWDGFEMPGSKGEKTCLLAAIVDSYAAFRAKNGLQPLLNIVQKETAKNYCNVSFSILIALVANKSDWKWPSLTVFHQDLDQNRNVLMNTLLSPSGIFWLLLPRIGNTLDWRHEKKSQKPKITWDLFQQNNFEQSNVLCLQQAVRNTSPLLHSLGVNSLRPVIA